MMMNQRNQDTSVGISGIVRVVRHNVAGLSGSGPNGRVEFEDLWKRDSNGRLVPKSRSRVIEDSTTENKILKRGTSRIIHLLMDGHQQTYTHSDITYLPLVEPFEALILLSDHTGQSKQGDARVDWDESDGQYNLAISSDSSTPYEGRRGVLLSDTSLPLKRVALVYPTTNPYRELEVTVYGAPVTLVRSIVGHPSDSITAASKTVVCTFGSFVVGDVGKTFVMRNSTVGNNGDRTIATYVSPTTITTVQTFASDESGDFLDETVPDGVYTAPIESGDKGTDRFPIMGVGLAAGIACGYDEADSQWGSRSILGFAPTLQGVSDRVYVHEGTGLHLYTGVEAVSGFGNGYVESGHVGSDSGDDCFDGDVTQEGIVGIVDPGGKWVSVDDPGPHLVGRVWNSTKTINGIRITMPVGIHQNYAPDDFTIQYLDPTANGGDPRPAQSGDWITVSGQTHTGEGVDIYNGIIYGKEYVFSSPVSTQGIKINAMTAYNSSGGAEIAELYIFEKMSALSFTLGSDKLRLKAKVGSSFKVFNLLTMASTQDVNDVVDAIGPIISGYEMVAMRSEFGYFWIKGSVAGDNSQVFLDTTGSGSNANAKVGFNVAGEIQTGITRPVTKQPLDAQTIIYRVNFSGDLLVP